MNFSKYVDSVFSILAWNIASLLLIWVFPNTIALRHILLAVGIFTSLFIILQFYKKYLNTLISTIPLLLLLLLFIWVLIHYFLYSLNPDLELKEISSLWLRVFGFFIVGIGTAIAIRESNYCKNIFFLSIYFIPIINILAYLYLSMLVGEFLSPIEFVYAFLFKKIEAAFFGVLGTSVACANLLFLIKNYYDRPNSYFYKIILFFSGIGLCLVSSLVAQTRNGVACIFILLIIFGIFLFRLFGLKHFINYFFIFLLTMFFLGLIWSYHIKTGLNSWSNLIENIQISSDFNQHAYWRVESSEWPQSNYVNLSNDKLIAGNVYQRAAWASVGIYLIKSYPLGYGSVNRSFVGLLNEAKMENRLISQTHSGWIDFGLAFGIPGLALIFLTLIMIASQGLISKTLWGLVAAWISLGLIPFGLVAEITYKHNFEILIFFISLSAALCLKPTLGTKGVAS